MKIIGVAVVAFVLGVLSRGARSAQAVEGLMCIDAAACGDKCETCVKDKASDAMGKCRRIAGCY